MTLQFSVFIRIVIAYFFGSTLILLRAKYAYQILSESGDELYHVTKLRTLSNLLHSFLNKKDMVTLTASCDFLIGNYYFGSATGKSFIGSKRVVLLNKMKEMVNTLQLN